MLLSGTWGRFLVGQRPFEVAQDDPYQDVFLAWPDAEPGDGLGRESMVGRLGQHGDLLDGIGVPAKRIPAKRGKGTRPRKG